MKTKFIFEIRLCRKRKEVSLREVRLRNLAGNLEWKCYLRAIKRIIKLT